VRDEGAKLAMNVFPVYCGKRPMNNEIGQKNARFRHIFAIARHLKV
jgi:hypothetical protein